MSTPLGNVILRGVRGSQPAASSVCTGSLYYVTDELLTERSNGVTWDSYSGTNSGGLVTVEVVTASISTDAFTFTGLDGNADLVYIILGRIKNGTGNAAEYNWKPNNITSNQAGFRGAATYSSLILGELAGNGYITFQITIAAQNDPMAGAFPRTYTGTTSELTTAPTASGGAVGGIWTDTTTNITSIVIDGGITNGIGEGSTVAIFKLA